MNMDNFGKGAFYRARGLLFLGVLVVLGEKGFGTTVVIIQGPGRVVYLAADRLQSSKESAFTRHICKIQKLDDMYWAAATNFYVHRSTRFDLETLVASIGRTGTLASRMQRFIEAARAPLEKEMASVEKDFPEEYARYAAGSPPLSIVFAGVENGDPTFIWTDFIPKKGEGRLTIKNVSPIKPVQPTAEEPINWVGFGYSDSFVSYLRDHPRQLFLDPGETIRTGLQTEESAHPKDVGEPFSILRIDWNGPQWIDHGECK